MSILIKGVEMPKSCESCPCKTADAFGGLGCQATGYIQLRKANQDRPDNCPIVPVPSHGRLIDADALYKVALERSETKNGYYNCLDPVISCYAIDRAPTIIQAEEGEERVTGEEKNKSGCKYCNRKPEFDRYGNFYDWDNEEEIAEGPWTLMYAGVDEKGEMVLVASGDGRAVYYPKYCPECGRKLEGE